MVSIQGGLRLGGDVRDFIVYYQVRSVRVGDILAWAPSLEGRSKVMNLHCSSDLVIHTSIVINIS